MSTASRIPPRNTQIARPTVSSAPRAVAKPQVKAVPREQIIVSFSKSVITTKKTTLTSPKWEKAKQSGRDGIDWFKAGAVGLKQIFTWDFKSTGGPLERPPAVIGGTIISPFMGTYYIAKSVVQGLIALPSLRFKTTTETKTL